MTEDMALNISIGALVAIIATLLGVAWYVLARAIRRGETTEDE